MLSATRLSSIQGKRLWHNTEKIKIERAHLLRWFCFVLKPLSMAFSWKQWELWLGKRGTKESLWNLKFLKGQIWVRWVEVGVCRLSERARQTWAGRDGIQLLAWPPPYSGLHFPTAAYTSLQRPTLPYSGLPTFWTCSEAFQGSETKSVLATRPAAKDPGSSWFSFQF